MNLLDYIPKGECVSVLGTLGAIGDSLSSGEHESYDKKTETRGYYDYYEYSWGQYIARKHGIKVYNFSRGGLTAKSFYEGYSKVCDCFTDGNKCQAYIIALGVNDFTGFLNGTNEYEGFGSIESVDFSDYNKNKNTFIGWYCKIIQRLRDFQPKCRIFVVNTPKQPQLQQERNKLAEDFNGFLKDLPKYFEYLYLVDINGNAPVYDAEFEKVFYCGGHLNALGYKFTGELIANLMDGIIRENYEDFKQIAFIGKGVHNELEKW